MEERLERSGEVVLPSFVTPTVAEDEIQETSYFRILPISDFLQFAETHKDTKEDPHRNHRDAQKFRPSEQYFGSVNIIDKKIGKVTTESPGQGASSQQNVFQPSFFNGEALPLIEDNSIDRDGPFNQSSIELTTSDPFPTIQTTLDLYGPIQTTSKAQPAETSVVPSQQPIPFNLNVTPTVETNRLPSISTVVQSKSGLFDFKLPQRKQQQSQ